jgi:hypothetical protein
MHDHSEFVDAKTAIDQLRDGLGMPVDEGIKSAVVAFRASGYTTTASCEGHADHGTLYPWIDFGVEKPAVTKSSSSVPLSLNELSKLLLEYSDQHSDVFVSAFAAIGKKEPRQRYQVFKKAGEWMIHNSNDQYVRDESSIKLMRVMLDDLATYHGSTILGYGQVLSIKPFRNGAFRLEPINAELNEFMTKKELTGIIRRQLASIMAFAEFVFERSHSKQ